MAHKHKPYDLDDLVHTYNIDNVYEHYKRLEFLEKLKPYLSLKNASILELGSATGQMTSLLSRRAKRVVAVDGSKEFIRVAKKRTRDALNVQYLKSYFEDVELDEAFDCLILHHVLEHIENPSKVLSALKASMHDDGIIALTVPNAYALSRQLAVKMGLLTSVYELTDNDKHHGHLRVYNWQSLEEQLVKSGYSIIGRHGLSFKLFSDRQNIEMLNAQIIGEDQIKALWELGDEFVDIAGAIMIVARKVCE